MSASLGKTMLTPRPSVATATAVQRPSTPSTQAQDSAERSLAMKLQNEIDRQQARKKDLKRGSPEKPATAAKDGVLKGAAPPNKRQRVNSASEKEAVKGAVAGTSANNSGE